MRKETSVELIELATGRKAGDFQVKIPSSWGFIGAVASSPDGRLVAAVVTWQPKQKRPNDQLNSEILVCDVVTRKLTATLGGYQKLIPGIAFMGYSLLLPEDLLIPFIDSNTSRFRAAWW